MNDIYIGIDLGTQSIKCIFIEYNKILKKGRIILTYNSSLFNIIQERKNYAEQDPLIWIRGLKEIFLNLKNDVNNNNNNIFNNIKNYIRGVSISGQQHGLVSINNHGDIIRPCMLWCDTRAELEAKEFTKFSGRYVPPGFTAPKIMWMINNELENYELTDKFMLPHDYMNYYLSNKKIFAMECGDASGTGLINFYTRDWDIESINFIHPSLYTKLPSKLTQPIDILGVIDENIAKELDISYYNNYGDIFITPGCGDNAMTMLGMSSITREISINNNIINNIKKSNTLLISLGTSGTLMLTSNKPIIDKSGGVALFADATGNWLSLVCIQNCTMIPEEIFLTYSSSHETNKKELERNSLISLASLESSGCDGLTILPYFSSGGERTPDWPNSTGCIIGLRHGYLQRTGLLYRSALESITFALYRGYKHLEEVYQNQQLNHNNNNNNNNNNENNSNNESLNFNEICVVGGGANNPLWKQIISDVFQLPVISYPSDISNNAAAIGAAVQAIAILTEQSFCSIQIENSSNQIEEYLPNSNDENQRNYQDAYNRHIKFSNLLFEK